MMTAGSARVRRVTSAVPGSGDGHGSTESDASTTPKNDTDDRSNPTLPEPEAVKFWRIARNRTCVAVVSEAGDALAAALVESESSAAWWGRACSKETDRAYKAEIQLAAMELAATSLRKRAEQAEQERDRLLRDQPNAKARESYYAEIVDALVKADVFDAYKAPEQYAPMLREWLKEQAEVSAERDRMEKRLDGADRFLRFCLGYAIGPLLFRDITAHLAAGTPTKGGDRG